MLLRFLQLRVVVNGKLIYPLEKQKPVVVSMEVARAQIVVTDGFHYTPPYDVVCTRQGFQQITIGCLIEDEQLIAGLILLILFYAASLTSGLLALKIMSFLPIFVFVYLFYIRRNKFLKIKYV